MEHNRDNNDVIGNIQGKSTTRTKGNLMGIIGMSRKAPPALSQPKETWIVSNCELLIVPKCWDCGPRQCRMRVVEQQRRHHFRDCGPRQCQMGAVEQRRHVLYNHHQFAWGWQRHYSWFQWECCCVNIIKSMCIKHWIKLHEHWSQRRLSRWWTIGVNLLCTVLQ